LILAESELDRFTSAIKDVVEDCHRVPGGVWDFGMGMAKRALSKPKSTVSEKTSPSKSSLSV
jgi:hypothetical protein